MVPDAPTGRIPNPNRNFHTCYEINSSNDPSLVIISKIQSQIVETASEEFALKGIHAETVADALTLALQSVDFYTHEAIDATHDSGFFNAHMSEIMAPALQRGTKKLDLESSDQRARLPGGEILHWR